MSRNYKNILKLKNSAFGTERRKNLTKEIVKDSTPMPRPLEYEDIDKEFNRWVKEDLYITFEGEELPTFALFSNQRFSEFLQSWNEVDEKKNLIMNFKTVTRENNPKAGTIVGNTRNIPGEHYILMKRVEAYDNANRRYFIDYKIYTAIVAYHLQHTACQNGNYNQLTHTCDTCTHGTVPDPHGKIARQQADNTCKNGSS